MTYLKCRTIKDLKFINLNDKCINLNDYIFPENCRDSEFETESIMKSEDEGNEQFTYQQNRIYLEFERE